MTNNQFEEETLSLIKAAMEDALSDDKFEELIAVTCGWNNRAVETIYYINCEVTEEIAEQIDDIDTYFLSHILNNFKSNYKIVRCQDADEMKKLKVWVYRKEQQDL